MRAVASPCDLLRCKVGFLTTFKVSKAGSYWTSLGIAFNTFWVAVPSHISTSKKVPYLIECLHVTSTDKVLGWLLIFALVRANGCWQCRATSRTNPLSGTRIPTSDVPGLRCGFRSGVRSKTIVTGPGKRSCRRLSDTVTFPHLQQNTMQSTRWFIRHRAQMRVTGSQFLSIKSFKWCQNDQVLRINRDQFHSRLC